MVPRFPVIGALLVLLALLLGLASSSCRATEPSSKPIDACRKSCEAKASRQCNDTQCERGCEFVIDRLVEREGERIIACIASSPRRCTDVVWADCAVKVGVHADGGPPPPPPPPEED